MPLRHNPQIGRGLIKFTFRSGDSSIKTSFFARRVNEYISSNDDGTFTTNNGTFTYGEIINRLWNAEARGERNNNFIISLYREVFGCEPITDMETRTQTVDHMGDSLQYARGTFEVPASSTTILVGEEHLVEESAEDLPDTFDDVIAGVTSTAEAIADEVRAERTRTRSTRPLRRLARGYYHQNGQGTSRHGLQRALDRIPVDSDGVRRSFGIEYEIYNLTAEQESDLCDVLDELPPCKPEHDGSLGSNGVELVFDPVGKDEYIRIVKTLRRFIDEHEIYMMDNSGSGAGMHTTYGVSNSHARITDTIRVGGHNVPLIQARLNRISSLMKVTATRQQIKDVFGRYFVGYARSSFSEGEDRYLRFNDHSNSMSIHGREPVDGIYTCWEFRLLAYKCNPEKVVDFLRATEWVFHHTMYTEDVTAMLNVLLPHNEVED